MIDENILKKLKEMLPELNSKYKLKSFGLFGSVVRDDFSNKSDIDILVEFEKPVGIEFIDLADEIEMLLGRKVDLVSTGGIKPKYLESIRNELIYV